MGILKFEETLGTEEELVTRKLEQWANEIGDKTFIYYGEEGNSLSYRTFNSLANSFANTLIERGVTKGDRISVFLKNPLISTIAMFGIWKTGAVFCPINFNYKGRLLSYQLNDTEPKMLITETQFIPIVKEIQMEINKIPVILYEPKEEDHDYNSELVNYTLDNFPVLSFEEIISGSNENPNVPIFYYDTANIIYTSGTTGNAKGVVQTYRWIHGYTYLLRALTKQEDIIYCDLPLYHVGGAFELVARGAYLGCTVALWDKFSPNDFWKRIKVSKASTAILLDVMIPWLMNNKPTDQDHANTLNLVHMQPLPKYHHKVAKRFGIHFITSGFGQTESGLGFIGLIDELEEGEGTPLNLYKGYTKEEMRDIAEILSIPVQNGGEELAKGYMGKTASYYEAAILNELDEECSVGEVGQIALRPRYPYLLLKEYFNNPNATIEAFRNMWFHTGDAGYKDENDTFFFVDRMKDVIRHKGENISSYQVEDLINQHEDINLCAAFPVPATEGDEEDIVVYVESKSDSLTVEELTEWTRETMPKFMWPKYIRIISEIPRTPTNKIEKYKLKERFRNEMVANEK